MRAGAWNLRAGTWGTVWLQPSKDMYTDTYIYIHSYYVLHMDGICILYAMYPCIYTIYMYVCIYIYLYVCIYIYVYIYIDIHIDMIICTMYYMYYGILKYIYIILWCILYIHIYIYIYYRYITCLSTFTHHAIPCTTISIPHICARRYSTWPTHTTALFRF